MYHYRWAFSELSFILYAFCTANSPALLAGLAVCISRRYPYRVLQTIQMKLILLSVWAEMAVLGITKTTLKFKYEIYIQANTHTIQCMVQDISLKSERKNP